MSETKLTTTQVTARENETTPFDATYIALRDTLRSKITEAMEEDFALMNSSSAIFKIEYLTKYIAAIHGAETAATYNCHICGAFFTNYGNITYIDNAGVVHNPLVETLVEVLGWDVFGKFFKEWINELNGPIKVYPVNKLNNSFSISENMTSKGVRWTHFSGCGELTRLAYNEERAAGIDYALTNIVREEMRSMIGRTGELRNILSSIEDSIYNKSVIGYIRPYLDVVDHLAKIDKTSHQVYLADILSRKSFGWLRSIRDTVAGVVIETFIDYIDNGAGDIEKYIKSAISRIKSYTVAGKYKEATTAPNAVHLENVASELTDNAPTLTERRYALTSDALDSLVWEDSSNNIVEFDLEVIEQEPTPQQRLAKTLEAAKRASGHRTVEGDKSELADKLVKIKGHPVNMSVTDFIASLGKLRSIKLANGSAAQRYPSVVTLAVDGVAHPEYLRYNAAPLRDDATVLTMVNPVSDQLLTSGNMELVEEINTVKRIYNIPTESKNSYLLVSTGYARTTLPKRLQPLGTMIIGGLVIGEQYSKANAIAVLSQNTPVPELAEGDEIIAGLWLAPGVILDVVTVEGKNRHVVITASESL